MMTGYRVGKYASEKTEPLNCDKRAECGMVNPAWPCTCFILRA